MMMVMITSAVSVSKKSETRVRQTASTGGMLAGATPARVIATTHVKMSGAMMLAMMTPTMVEK